MESKRLAQIIGHIDVGGTSPITSCPTAATTSTFSSSYHSNAAFPFISPSLTHLQSLLDGSQSKIRSIMRNIIDTESLLDEAKSLESHYYEERAMNLEKLKRVAELSAPHIHLRDLQRDPAKMFAWFETLAMYDHNLVLKFVVQYNLWGGTILLLGTQHHHNRYVDGISAGHIPGIFGLTELGHGSNVQRLETTATYDNKTKEFVIHSPQRTSAKYWPGGIVRDGVAATIFARLILDGKEHGIHAFVVPIRESPAAKPYPGIEVWDIGHKGTYNGMDNGGLLFSHVRIPRENMLNRFSDVADDGKYVNKMKDARAHFGATMGVFLGGRICAGLICLSAAKCGLYIALHYAHHRHQFGPDGEREIPIIAHRTHQTRLMPHLARAYTLDMILKHSISLFVNQDQSNAAQIKMLHALSSGLKAISTWDSFNALQECRECMGGQGIVTKNRVIILRDQVDMFLTGEGDNTVMLQQVSKYLLALYHSEKKNSSSASSTGPGPIGANTPTDTTSVTSNLLSPTYQAQLLTLLESSMLHQLSTSLTHAQRTTSTSSATQREFMIWNDHLPQSNRVAMVHIRRMIQQHVRTVVDATVDQATRDVLNVIAHLDALVSIHEYSSYLLAHGLMRPSEGIVLPDIIVDLCRRLTPHALTLVEAFGIPKKCRTMDQSNQID